MKEILLRKIFRELELIRKELHAIRSNMEPRSKSVIQKKVNEQNFEVKTNVDDKATAECAVNINEALDDIDSKIYRGEQPRHHKEAEKDIFKVLYIIDEAILEKYAEIKQQGRIQTGIENLYHQVSFDNPELAAYIKKRMMQIAKENGDLP